MGMMNICLSHDTAFQWLMRNKNPRRRGLGSNARVLPLSSPSVQQGRLLHDELSLAEGALEVLVCRSNGRRETGCIKSHLSGVAYPAGSFVRVPVADVPGVYAASPELVFRQIAAKHSLLEAVYVGYALCSSYRVDAAVEGGIAPREGDDEPLTSVERIGEYLRKTEGSYGCAKARRALSYVREGSTSPTESALAIGLTLPLCLGGFGAGDIVLRGGVEAGNEAKRHADSGFARSVSLTMENGCDGADRVSFVVVRGGEAVGRKVIRDSAPGALECDGVFVAGEDAEARKVASGPAVRRRQDLTVTSAQIREFGSYVKLCERVRRKLALRDQHPKDAELSPRQAARRDAIAARQADLWRTLICFSSFRQAETGECVKVFDPPCIREAR